MSPAAVIKALILDCDGVLADTEKDGHLVAFNLAFDDLGLPFRWDEETYGKLLRVGGGKERFAAYLREHPEIDTGRDVAELAAEVHQRKTQHYVELIASGAVPSRPGVKRLVQEALDAGWLVAEASTSAVVSVEAVLKSVVGEALRGRMAGVFAGDMVPKKKPAPDIYWMAMKQIGVEPDQVIVIEDSASGAQAAAAAGCKHLVTLSYYTVDEQFPDAAAIVSDLGEPGAPMTVIEGPEFVREREYVDLATLDRLLSEA